MASNAVAASIRVIADRRPGAAVSSNRFLANQFLVVATGNRIVKSPCSVPLLACGAAFSGSFLGAF
ncbi:hypothetical protein [Azospirillum rugosum]|uniref:Uncharacterized protein n=1 Tax=Azospirillum rugosum TaxID=416170 RepID=A0ABS4SMG6_9PROT|nr:hypothetical protein [Azospirillum rugosum]MBP2293720.1 hypothetical protein [Azospirillum rugosum]MDQ0527265.1 hypothetical protein [Azospirillum rugosum]